MLKVQMSQNTLVSAQGGERCEWKLNVSHQFIAQPKVRNGLRPLFCSRIKLLDNMPSLFSSNQSLNTFLMRIHQVSCKMRRNDHKMLLAWKRLPLRAWRYINEFDSNCWYIPSAALLSPSFCSPSSKSIKDAVKAW